MLTDIDQLLDTFSDTSELKGEQTNDLAYVETLINAASGADLQRRVPLLLAGARLAFRQGEFQRSLAWAGQVDHAETRDKWQMEALLLVGLSASQMGQYDLAESSFHQAASISKKCNHPVGEANALHSLAASVLLVRGKLNLAISYAEQANVMFNQNKIRHWGWPWLRTYIYLIQGDRRRARHILFEMTNEIAPATLIAGAYYFLWARLSIDEEEYDKANEYLRLGLRIATQTGASDLNLWLRIEHSRYYRGRNHTATALEWAEEALRHAQRVGLPYFEGLASIELAQVYWQLKNTERALKGLDSAKAILSTMQAEYDLAYISYLQALWAHQLDSQDAETCWGEASNRIATGGYAFILENDQEHAFHLVATWLKNGDKDNRATTDLLLENLAQVPPQPLRVACLGRFAVWKGRQMIPSNAWTRRKAGDLFRFLLLQPGRKAAKETVLEALWPELEPDSGLNLLHQSTSSLRRLLEPDLPEKFPSRYLVYEGEQLLLNIPPGSIVDFEVFEHNLRDAITAQRADLIQEALNIYAGELFPEDRFNDWTTELRTRLNEQFMEGLVKLAALYLTQERHADALDRVNQAIGLDPWNEDAVEIGMNTYLRLGSAPHALRLFNQLADILKKDLDIAPRKALRALAESIKKQ